MASLYFVRSNGGEYTTQFINGGFVAIGWLDEVNLASLKSKDDLVLAYTDFHSFKSPQSIGRQVGQITRFIFDIEIGDYVITQSVTSSQIHYGLIESDYYFEETIQDDCPFPHRRKVRWIGEYSRGIFTKKFQDSLRAGLTVFELKDKPDFFSRVRIGNKVLVEKTPLTERVWAVEVENKFYMKWSESDRYSKVILGLEKEEFDFSKFLNLDDFISEIPKINPNLPEVSRISRSLNYFSKLEIGDLIFDRVGVDTIKRVGVVMKSSFKKSILDFLSIEIIWFSTVEFKRLTEEALDASLDIQLVKSEVLDFLGRDLLMPFLSTNDINLNFFLPKEFKELPPKVDPGGPVRIFYGTNRNRTGRNVFNDYFGSDLDTLKVGFCEITIPPGHIRGNIERPFSFWVCKFPEDAEKHVVLQQVSQNSEAEFIKLLAKEVEVREEKSAMIFIHGYNVSFAEAARRAGQIAYDTRFKGVSGFFSWPSQAKFEAYLSDETFARSSINDFGEFLRLIIDNTRVDTLHLVAHSMGSLLLSETLKHISNHNSINNSRAIKQIVFGAPDIDQKDFRLNFLPTLKGIGARRTIYASDKDKALQTSTLIRKGQPRLGDAKNLIFVESGVDTIDASNVKSSRRGHSYIFDTKELINDLSHVLNNGIAPSARNLRPIAKRSLQYWLFPE